MRRTAFSDRPNTTATSLTPRSRAFSVSIASELCLRVFTSLWGTFTRLIVSLWRKSERGQWSEEGHTHSARLSCEFHAGAGSKEWRVRPTPERARLRKTVSTFCHLYATVGPFSGGCTAENSHV
jgi:hypothetical protein